MSSPSDRVYSMEQLFQFDSSRSQSSAASTNSSSSPTRLAGFTGMGMGMCMGISPVALSHLRSFFPDIVPEETTTTGADPANLTSDNNMDIDSDNEGDEEEDDGFVYGDVVVRSDLQEDIVEQLRQAVHDALSPPRALLTSPITSSSVSSSSFTFANERSKPLSHHAKPSDLPWRSSHPTSTTTMGPTNTRGRQHYSPPLSSYSYHDRANFGVNLFKQASALHPTSPRSSTKMGADSDNWRQSRESRVSSWRNTNYKWNESTSSYVPVVV